MAYLPNIKQQQKVARAVCGAKSTFVSELKSTRSFNYPLTTPPLPQEAETIDLLNRECKNAEEVADQRLKSMANDKADGKSKSSQLSKHLLWLR